MRYGVCRPEATRDRTFARRCGDTRAGDAGTDVGEAQARAQVSDAGTDVSESEAGVHASGDASDAGAEAASITDASDARLNRAVGATSLNRAKRPAMAFASVSLRARRSARAGASSAISPSARSPAVDYVAGGAFS